MVCCHGGGPFVATPIVRFFFAMMSCDSVARIKSVPQATQQCFRRSDVHRPVRQDLREHLFQRAHSRSSDTRSEGSSCNSEMVKTRVRDCAAHAGLLSDNTQIKNRACSHTSSLSNDARDMPNRRQNTDCSFMRMSGEATYSHPWRGFHQSMNGLNNSVKRPTCQSSTDADTQKTIPPHGLSALTWA